MSGQSRRTVFVRCHFGPGDFPTDRKFQIDGHELSTADENYCYAINRKTLIGAMNPSRKKPSPGYVVGILIGSVEDGFARIECPDGDIYRLREDQFEQPKKEGMTRDRTI